MTDRVKTLRTYSAWKVRDKEQDTILTRQFLGAKLLREKLKDLLERKRLSCDEVSLTDYDKCPSWSHKQAHLNGKKEAYDEVLKLITVEVDHAE